MLGIVDKLLKFKVHPTYGEQGYLWFGEPCCFLGSWLVINEV